MSRAYPVEGLEPLVRLEGGERRAVLPGLGVAVEQQLDELHGVAVLLALEVRGVLELLCDDLLVDVVGVFEVFPEGHVAAHELVQEHPDRPQVHVQAVPFAAEDLRRHVVRRAQNGEGFVAVLGVQDLRSAHVDDLQPALVVDHQVLGLQVAVDYVLAVQVLDAQDDRPDVVPRFVVAEQVW